MILSCSHISKSFGTEKVLTDITFHLEAHDKAALTGANGAGKSTLLNIITGHMQPDEGEVTIAHGVRIGYLAQYQDSEGDDTIYNEVRKSRQHIFDMEQQLHDMEEKMKTAEPDEYESIAGQYASLSHKFELMNGFAAESEITGVLKGLGFAEDDFDRKMSTLSGGQKTRIVLGKLLLDSPDILLLDEPTNHLDLGSVEWLEQYLSGYSGTVLLVSHDRYFLNRIVGKVIEIENGLSVSFDGNYDVFSRKKAVMRKTQYNSWVKQQAEIKHQEAVIAKLRQFNREKSVRRAESREKSLEKTKLLEKPEVPDTEMRIELKPRIESGKDVLSVKNLSKAYNGISLFSGQSFEIKRGERVAVIGDNGTGKSTLLKIITGIVKPDSGETKLGAKVHIGYYDQEQQLLHDEKTIFEELSDAYPSLDNTEIRNVLAAFLFTGDDVFKLIGSLSGGERGRVALARLMLSEANFLILDEPTNHLDMTSREILEDALDNYSGTVLCVSHDRYFINRTATRILELTGGIFINYNGNYDYYTEKKDTLRKAYLGESDGRSGFDRQHSSSVTENPSESDSSVQSGGKQEWEKQKEEAARRRKKEAEIRKTEDEIASLEARTAEINEEFLNPSVSADPVKCQELSTEQSEISEKLEKLYNHWSEISE